MKKFKYLALLSPMLLMAAPLYAEVHDATVKQNISSDLQTNVEEEEKEIKSVIATGYGVDHDAALKNALQTAVEQQIGILIDSETIIKNDNLIKNEILTASNGFVKKYDELSTSVNNGLTEVKIKAEVKPQAVAKKIQSLNIATLKAEGVSDIYAEAKTKEKAKIDSQAIFDNTMKEILSKQNHTELLNVSLNDYKVLTDKTENGKTPIIISVKVSFDYPAYEEKIKKLETTLNGIGAIQKTKIDYPIITPIKGEYIPQGALEITSSVLKGHPDERKIYIIKKNGKKYIVDTWTLPENIKYNQWEFDKLINYDLITVSSNTISIEIVDKHGDILDAKKSPLNLVRFNSASFYGLSFSFSQNHHGVFLPFFGREIYDNSAMRHADEFFVERDLKTTMTVDTEDLKNFDKVQVSYE